MRITQFFDNKLNIPSANSETFLASILFSLTHNLNPKVKINVNNETCMYVQYQFKNGNSGLNDFSS